VLNDDEDTPAEVFTLVAENPGEWGNRLQYQIEHAPAPNVNNEFTLSVQLVDDLTAQRPVVLMGETHRGLTVANAEAAIENDSKLVRLTPPTTANTNLPAETSGLENLVAVSTTLTGGGTTDVFLVNARDNSEVGERIQVTVANPSTGTFDLTINQLDQTSTTAIVTETFTGISLGLAATIINRDSRLVRLTRVTDDGDTTLPDAMTDVSLTRSGTLGTNGDLPGSTNWNDNAAALLEGSASNPADKTGMHALEDIAPEIFNIMCIPDAPGLGDTGAQAVYAAANAFCVDQRAVLIIDQPVNVGTPAQALAWGPLASLRSDHAAIYFPRVLTPDPLNGNRQRNIPNSGTMAGLYARTDSQRGVWKAPAGTDLPLRNVTLASRLTDAENGELNPFGINALRSLPIYGNVSWGARTLFGENARAHEYGYMSVRRTALFIEESLFQGLQWVVFEPNDEKLWSQIRVNVGAFMQDLFRRKAFAGIVPRDAYLVKCDAETTTPTDVNLGIVNIVVGFAPLKPAEFVIIKLQQLTKVGEV
jgi:phage tail sheath protein FI